MIIALIIFLATLVIKLVIDLRSWLKFKHNQHWRGSIVVFFALLVCSQAAGWLSTPIWFFGYWAIFDTAYALLIGEKWNYTGTTAELDILQKRWPWLKWIKYAGFFIATVLYILKG